MQVLRPGPLPAEDDIDSFFTASGKAPFTSRLIISTTEKWGEDAEDALDDQQIPVARLGLSEIVQSPVRWDQVWASPALPKSIWTSTPSAYCAPDQEAAVENVLNGFASVVRGKLIMVCGTGRTFTSLKIAERLAVESGRYANVLFLVPFISLLSQSLREWTAQTETAMRSFAVCSEAQLQDQCDLTVGR